MKVGIGVPKPGEMVGHVLGSLVLRRSLTWKTRLQELLMLFSLR
ncbi:hypothetical protein [Rubritalea tangerina]